MTPPPSERRVRFEHERDPRKALLRLAIEKPGAKNAEVNDQPWSKGHIANTARAATVFVLRSAGLLEPSPGRGLGGLYATKLGALAYLDQGVFDTAWRHGSKAARPDKMPTQPAVSKAALRAEVDRLTLERNTARDTLAALIKPLQRLLTATHCARPEHVSQAQREACRELEALMAGKL